MVLSSSQQLQSALRKPAQQHSRFAAIANNRVINRPVACLPDRAIFRGWPILKTWSRNTMIPRTWGLLASFFSFALADVKFTSPAAGDKITGTTINIEWKESGTAPPIASLVSYQLFLCAGGNDANSFVRSKQLTMFCRFTDLYRSNWLHYHRPVVSHSPGVPPRGRSRWD